MKLNYLRYYHNIKQFILKYFTYTRIAVQLIIICQEKILLVEHSYAGKYYFPGGGVKKGESLKNAIIREIYEELGIKIKYPKLYNIYENYQNNHHDYVFVYHSSETVCDKDIKIDNLEINRYFWLPIKQLDKYRNKLSPATYKVIKEYDANFSSPSIKNW